MGNGIRAASLFQRFGVGAFRSPPSFWGSHLAGRAIYCGVDGGLDQRLAGNKLLFGLTYFYTRLQRVIEIEKLPQFLRPNCAS